ncbi:hypothetical protein Fmac_029832 [Flemingia macrophylla]|uniref:Uncharacterized protein n=1 Tax=Flemingia macrophylla TaxID=520843 RepID=A0ABD1LBF2_9FABA
MQISRAFEVFTTIFRSGGPHQKMKKFSNSQAMKLNTPEILVQLFVFWVNGREHIFHGRTE